MELTQNSIIQEIKTSGRLPSPTGVALTILDLTRDPNTSTKDMAKVLVGDPSLTGQLLKYANSADRGTRQEITNINDALVRLGMSSVRQLCLGFSVLSNARTGACVAFDYKKYWTHSLAMAVSCQALCRLIGAASPDEGFTCGLLGRIGHLALASVYPEHYTRILKEWEHGPDGRLLEIESRELSINHNEVSATLFEDWGLPKSYRMAVELQEEQEWGEMPTGRSGRDRAYQLGRILSISILAANIVMEDGPERHPLVLEFMKVGEELGFQEETWKSLYDEILDNWSHLGRLLNIVTSNVPSMDTLMRQAKEYKEVIKNRPRTKTTTSRNAPSVLEVPAKDEDLDLIDPKVSLNILVASDSPVDRRILEKKLGAAGHRVFFAENGRQGLELTLQESPQLILTDWKMPEMDGLEMSRCLRQSRQANSTYIIIMTAQEGSNELVEAFDAGIDDYVTKPINHRIMAARLKAAMRLVALQEQAARDREEVRQTMIEMGILNRMLHTMALEDQLTKLPNRRSGLDHLDKEWARTTRANESLLVMIMDIDHFKAVNDTYGHDAGDIVLQRTAAAMQNCMRDSDVVCRFGGEEFLVICPGADIEVAKMVGDRLRKAIQNNKIDTPEFQGNVTISIGVAARSADHDSPKDLIKEADEALYAAKEAGRNLVCIANLE